MSIHRCVPYEQAVLDGVVSDEMPLAVGNETAKEHPEGLAGAGVGIITVVFNDMKFVSRVAQVNTPTKWKKGESLNRTQSEH